MRAMTSPAIDQAVRAPAGRPWELRRSRAAHLGARLSYASEITSGYARLLDAQEEAHSRACVDRPSDTDLASYIVRRAGPAVVAAAVEVTAVVAEAAGPWLRERAADSVDRWLAGGSQPPIDTFLARACAAPVLEALASCGGLQASAGDGRHCPICGGLPQLAFTANSDDPLVTAPLRLCCARCGGTWPAARLSCVACGEADTARLWSFTADELVPHLRVDACRSCRTYLVHVDLRRDPAAVPEVDELAALPLDLHAQEEGFGKVIGNLMGIG